MLIKTCETCFNADAWRKNCRNGCGPIEKDGYCPDWEPVHGDWIICKDFRPMPGEEVLILSKGVKLLATYNAAKDAFKVKDAGFIFAGNVDEWQRIGPCVPTF